MRFAKLVPTLVLVGFVVMACGGSNNGGTAAAKKIALLLPESKTARYESKDRPYFVAKLKSLGFDTDAHLLYSHADQDDNHAKLFKQGAHSILDGKVTIAKEYDTPSWSPDKAQTEMQGAITAVGKNIDGVYAANDGTAGGAIAAMKSAGITPLPPITGQDAELAAIQRILGGEQYMTVYKALKAEAEAAATLAYDLATGAAVPASMTNGKTTNNGAADIKSVLLTPVAVTKANIKDTVVADGFWTKADICTGTYAAACTSAGIS